MIWRVSEQPLNAVPLIFFSPAEITRERALYAKASYPILVTLSGIVMLVRERQPSNARKPMLVTPLGITTRCFFLQ